jgi:hypothetical protein
VEIAGFTLKYCITLYRLALVLPVILLSSCAVTGGWQFKKEDKGVQLYLQEYPDSAIPEFRGTVRINSTTQQIMMVLTDFADYPNWVYQCKEARIVEEVSNTEAYIYQVIDLPLVRDRDILLHGKTISVDSGNDITIQLNAVPDYCQHKNTTVCQTAINSNRVHVTQSVGSIHLKQIDQDWVEVTWQQHLDPDGAIPDWATRLLLANVPIKSLERLKAIVEQDI